jgi:hypothetical protein
MLLWNKLQVLNPQGALTPYTRHCYQSTIMPLTLRKEWATLVIPIASNIWPAKEP